jgi:hypothetical protein
MTGRAAAISIRLYSDTYMRTNSGGRRRVGTSHD